MGKWIRGIELSFFLFRKVVRGIFGKGEKQRIVIGLIGMGEGHRIVIVLFGNVV